MTLIDPDVVEEQRTDDGDHDRFTHIVRKRKGEVRSAEAMVMESRIFGEQIQAYCGIWFVATRDESKYQVCPMCIEQYEKEAGKPWPGRR